MKNGIKMLVLAVVCLVGILVPKVQAQYNPCQAQTQGMYTTTSSIGGQRYFSVYGGSYYAGMSVRYNPNNQAVWNSPGWVSEGSTSSHTLLMPVGSLSWTGTFEVKGLTTDCSIVWYYRY